MDKGRNTDSYHVYLEDDELIDAVHKLWPEVRANLQYAEGEHEVAEAHQYGCADTQLSVSLHREALACASALRGTLEHRRTESMTTSLTRSGSLPPISRMACDPMLLWEKRHRTLILQNHEP
jgi:hypothetical protein